MSFLACAVGTFPVCLFHPLPGASAGALLAVTALAAMLALGCIVLELIPGHRNKIIASVVILCLFWFGAYVVLLDATPATGLRTVAIRPFR